MIAVGVGTAVGLNALLSRKIGQHKAEEACQAATTGLFLMLITSLIFSVAGIFFSDTIASRLTSELELQELCRQYLSINLVYCWGLFLQTYGQRLLQAVGDTVLRGQKIAEANGFVSAPIYASVSGTVKAIEPRRVTVGDMVNSIVIESDGEMKEVEFTATEDVTKLSNDEIIGKIKEAGVVGMGGAGFPTHV